jgi:hypothetical protein
VKVVAIKTKVKVVKSPDELLKWIKDLSLELHTEHWRILDKQPRPKGQRMIFLIYWDSHIAIKWTKYKFF